MAGIFDFMGNVAGGTVRGLGKGWEAFQWMQDPEGHERKKYYKERTAYERFDRMQKMTNWVAQKHGVMSEAHQQSIKDALKQIKASPELQEIASRTPLAQGQEQQEYGTLPGFYRYLSPEQRGGAAQWQGGLTARPETKGDWFKRVMDIRDKKDEIDRETDPDLWNALIGEEQNLIEKHGMSKADVQNEIKHRKRTASLNRIQELAGKSGRDDLIKRAGAALKQENRRYNDVFGFMGVPEIEQRKSSLAGAARQGAKASVTGNVPGAWKAFKKAKRALFGSPEEQMRAAQAQQSIEELPPTPQTPAMAQPATKQPPSEAYSGPVSGLENIWEKLSAEQKVQAWQAFDEGYTAKEIQNFLSKRLR